ncbi:MAG: hypothetical protein IIY49_03100, partial [Eubacterium sp.]|nr:hypothetical protein [Eubacterium sp.]
MTEIIRGVNMILHIEWKRFQNASHICNNLIIYGENKMKKCRLVAVTLVVALFLACFNVWITPREVRASEAL